MEFAERIILAFSRHPDHQDRSEGADDDPLEILETEFPDLKELVSGKSILDFGCGHGRQTKALIEKYGATAVGLDISEKAILIARNIAGHLARFDMKLNRGESFDVIITQNAMEHFSDPVAVLNDMVSVLKPGGRILVTFGPPWYAPYGSHMNFFCRIPWVNVLFPERAVMKVRSKYRSDGAKRYEEVESGLNKMSLGRFERLAKSSGLEIERVTYRCVKRQNWLAKIPVLREFVCNHVTAILRRP